MVDIDELERLLAAATPGDEWFVVRYGDGDSLVICEDEAGNQRVAFMAVPGCRDHLARKRTWKAIKANAALIVAARNSLPAILTEIRELRAENARLRLKWAELHNTCNVVGSPYDEALQAVDRLVSHVRTFARAKVMLRLFEVKRDEREVVE